MNTLEYIPPADLLVDVNVRRDLHLDKDFLASIKDRGVLVPIVAVRTEQGLRVRDGHRRTAAAIDAELTNVPVFIVQDDGSDATRIINQIVVNTHRAGLTDADTVAAVEQLALLGASAATIAKKTRIPRPKVDAALTVADHATSRDTVNDGLDLEMAAWLTEFEDEPEVWKRIRDSFRDYPSRARHTVENARRDRDERNALTAAEAQLTAQGHTRHPGNVWQDKKAKFLSELVDDQGEDLTIEGHAGCPGNAYDLSTYSRGRLDCTELPGPNGAVAYASWLCADWRAHGHRDKFARPDAPNPTADEQKEQRRLTIALNRLGDAAKTVREEWLTKFTLTRKKALPDTAHRFMLDALDTTHLCAGEKTDGLPHVLALLKINPDHDVMPDQTAAHILLCARLWTFERHATREIWRQDSTHRFYLDAIESWGYVLADVEKAGAGHITAEDAYRRHLEEGAGS